MPNWLAVAKKELAAQSGTAQTDNAKDVSGSNVKPDETTASSSKVKMSPVTRAFEEGISANDREGDTSPARTRVWRVAHPNRTAMEVVFAPEVTAEDVREVYPGAIVEPIIERVKRLATPAEARELRALIAEVLCHESEAERADALTIACADPDNALLSLRLLREDL